MIRPGDKITYVDGLLVHARVVGFYSAANKIDYIKIVRHGLAGDVVGLSQRVQDENVTWVRGHVDDKSEAGAALLAICAMKLSRAIDLKEAEQLYLSGAMSESAWRQNLNQWDREFDEDMKR